MKKLLLLLTLLLLLSGCSKITVLEVVYVDSYYRVVYDTEYGITSRNFYTVYGVNNFMRNNVGVNMSEWPSGE